MHGYFAKAIDYSGGAYGEGILSRLPGEVSTYSLPIPKGGEGRALLTLLATLPGGQKIVFAGTHLCHEHDENRLAQAKAIATILAGSKLPVILGGDFNFRPDTAPYQMMRQQFLDAALVKGEPQFTIPFDQPRARIDYIFLSKKSRWVVTDVQVIRDNASDHMPVLVTLSLK